MRSATNAGCGLIDSSISTAPAGQTMSLAHPAERDVGMERTALGRKPDPLPGPLDPVLQQLEIGTGVDIEPEDPRLGGERKDAAAIHRERHRHHAVDAVAEHLDDGLVPVGRDLAEKLERDVKAFLVDPAHRPGKRAKLTELPGGGFLRAAGKRDRGEKPHQADSTIARRDPRR